MTSKVRRYGSVVVLLAVLSALTFVLLRPPIKHMDSGIAVCERPASEAYGGLAFQTEITDLERQLVGAYSESPNLDLQVIFHSVSNPLRIDRPITESLATLAEENPQHRNSSIYLLNACTRFSDHPVCTTEVIDRALAFDRENAAVWALVASLRYSQGDSFGAAVALNAANAAPDFNDYFQEQLALIKTAIPEVQEPHNGFLYEQAYYHGLSMQITNSPSMNPLSRMCREQTGNNPLLANSCINYGTRLVEEASTLAGIRMGERIQYSAELGQGNESEYQRIELESRNRIRTNARREARLANNLMDYDPQLFVYQFDQVTQNGEQRTIENQIAEARRRSSEIDYNPCPGTQFTNALFNIMDIIYLITR